MKKLILSLLLITSLAAADVVPVTLAWDQNAEPDIDHYELMIGVADKIYDQSFTTTDINQTVNLESGKMYYAVVEAVDTSGLRSLPSKQLVFQVYKPGQGVAPSAPTGLKKMDIRVSLQSSPDLRIWTEEYAFLYSSTGEPQQFFRLALKGI